MVATKLCRDQGCYTYVQKCTQLNNKIGKITKYRQQFDDFYNFGKYGDCGEFLSNHQMYVNQFHTWCPAMLANMAILANSCQITKCM